MKKFNILYIDPPWKYDNAKSDNPAWGGKTYPCMTLEELKELPVPNIAAEDCYLFMWATKPKMEQAFELMKAWGFRYVTTPFVWLKTNQGIDTIQVNPKMTGVYSGLGYFTNGNVEDVLLGRRGKTLPRLRKDIKQVVIAPRGKHSEKPQEVKSRIVQAWGDLPRLEMFARDKYDDGWNYWGNEVECDIELKQLDLFETKI